MSKLVSSLVWLRRDLRLKDNLSLSLSMQHSGKVQPIFIFDEHILSRFSNPRDRRLSLIKNSLKAIDKELKKHNSELLVFYGKPELLVPHIAKILDIESVYAGEDYEPYGIKRDKLIAKELSLKLNNDHLLIAPNRVCKDDKSPYKVFTPYFKKWLSKIEQLDYVEYKIYDNSRYAETSKVKEVLAQNNLYPLNLNDEIPGYFQQELNDWSLDDLPAKFKQFVDYRLSSYGNNRNNLADNGTSCFSPYIRFGNISIRQCYRAAIDGENSFEWLTELAWRDFYAMILYYFPETIDMEMQVQYRGIQWSSNQELLAKFTSGQTGYPIIDAAINQLLKTGWMHNRARMIVASFMTKNLWLNWRLGEEFFAQHLLDYELSSNVGGWQWSASVGTDAQPYFRMFNPYLQSKKFDPNGNYIRKYLPELRLLTNNEIHKPKPLFSGKYCIPIVDYEISRKKAINYFNDYLKGKNYDSR